MSRESALGCILLFRVFFSPFGRNSMQQELVAGCPTLSLILQNGTVCEGNSNYSSIMGPINSLNYGIYGIYGQIKATSV